MPTISVESFLVGVQRNRLISATFGTVSYFVDLEFVVIEGKIKFKYLNNFMCIVHLSISFVVANRV